MDDRVPEEKKARDELVAMCEKHNLFMVWHYGHFFNSLRIFKNNAERSRFKPEIYAMIYEELADKTGDYEMLAMVKFSCNAKPSWCVVLKSADFEVTRALKARQVQ